MFAVLGLFSDRAVLKTIREVCPELGDCLVDSSARYLGVEVGPGAWMRQRDGVDEKVRRAVEAVQAEEGERMMAPRSLGSQCVFGVSAASDPPLVRAQFVGVWTSESAGFLGPGPATGSERAVADVSLRTSAGQMFRSLGFSAEAPGIFAAADSARVRASEASPCYARCIAELGATDLAEESLPAHPLRNWVDEGILRSTQRARTRVLAVPRALDASRSAHPQAACIVLVVARVDGAALALAVLRHRLFRWVLRELDGR